jgi:hypothetical protein
MNTMSLDVLRPALALPVLLVLLTSLARTGVMPQAPVITVPEN